MPIMKTTYLIIALFTSLLLSGCSSMAPEKGGMIANTLCTVSIGDCTYQAIEEQDDAIISILTGKPVAFVKARLGLPNRRNELASGSKTWTYFDNSKGINAKDCKVSLSIRNNIVERVNISTANQSFASFLSKGCQRIRKDVS